jgi:hypothetical protein
MVLHLKRRYFPDGTNGQLTYEGKHICNTIELPWLDNRRRLSCIPEGEYFLKKRYSRKYKWHIQILQVPDRSLILLHPANNALVELNGCIAPVTKLSGAGTGIMSHNAFIRLKNLVFKQLDEQQTVLLIIYKH